MSRRLAPSRWRWRGRPPTGQRRAHEECRRSLWRQMKEEFLVAFGAGQLGSRFAGDLVAIAFAPGPEPQERSFDHDRVAHDASPPDVGLADLELRLEERHQLRGRSGAPHGGQHFLEADERQVGDDQADRLREGVEVAGVHALDHHHARVLAQAPVDQAAADVDREHLYGTTPQQHVGEPAGRRADVGADSAGGIDAEAIQRRAQLQSASTRIPRALIDRDDIVVAHRAIRAALGLTRYAHLSGQDQGLGALPGLDEPVLREHDVKAWHRLQRMSPTPMPSRAPTTTSTGVWPSSSRSFCSCMPRICTRSSTRRFRMAACRPAARRSPAASYITTNEKIRAIANAAEETPAYLPTAVVMPITIAAWLLGMPPVSARTRRFSLRCRHEVRITLAAWAIAQANTGARRNFTPLPGGPTNSLRNLGVQGAV